MLIEQIIEVKLRGPGPPGNTCTPTSKLLQEAVYLTSPRLDRITNKIYPQNARF